MSTCLLRTATAAACLLLAAPAVQSAPAAQAAPAAPLAQLDADFHPAALPFLPNLGQHDASVRFYMLGGNTTAFFGDDGLRLVLSNEKVAARPRGLDLAALAGANAAQAAGNADPRVRVGHALELRFLNANRAVEPAGYEKQRGTVSRFSGPSSSWKTGAATFGRLMYTDLWPGIDLSWTSRNDALKYEFLVDGGADPSRIGFVVRGATGARVLPNGDLQLDTPARPFVDHAPIAWQEIRGEKVPVAARWTVRKVRGGELVLGFDVQRVDASQPLVIDPAVLVFSTYLGGSGEDRGLGVAVDPAGNTYICGETPNGSSYDAYIAKYDPTGTTLVYLGFLGGNNYDACYDVAVNAAGEVYLTGATSSTQTTFPTFLGPDRTYGGGSSDAFVCKVNAAGSALLFCGYQGGSGVDFAEGIALDAAGNVYIEGLTESTQSTFPVKVGPDLTYNGKGDTFVTKYVPIPTSATVLNNIVYSGFIGGSAIDYGNTAGYITNGHVGVDASGAAYVSGMTKSTQTTFPSGSGFGTLPSFDKTHGGRYDGYVAKVKADGTGLAYAGFIGGSGDDFANGMGIDAAGNAYVTGDTSSSQATFQPKVGPDLTYGGNGDAFVAKVNAGGTSLDYLGYVGGSQLEQGHGLTANAAGNAFVAGHSMSTTAQGFPAVVGPDLTFNGSGPDIGDAIICKLKLVPNDPVPANNFEYCGYIGGAGEDHAFWVALDAAGNALVVGDTTSTQTTFPDGAGQGALPGQDTTANGGTDAFLVKVVQQ